MSDVIIHKKNNVFLKIECNDEIHRELREHYTFLIEGAKFHPLVKAHRWDGKKRLYNMKSRELYTGLLHDLQANLKKMGYTYEHQIEIKTDVEPEEVVEYCNNLKPYSERDGGLLNIRDYQYAAVYVGLKHKRRVVISPTASGKSLILYCLMRKFLEDLEGKILIIVPLVDLARQLFQNFSEYSAKEEWSTEENCHTIYSGQGKNSPKRVYISTYQSIYKEDIDYFKQFDAVMVDETHKAKSDSFVAILEKCINADFRLGFTGTLDGWQVNELVVQGLLGKVTKVAETADLMERGDLAKLKINFYELQYAKEVKKELNFENYQAELDWIIAYKNRNHFIKQLANHVDGNVLILFQYVKKHGNELQRLISENSQKTVHYIHGKVDEEIRDEIKEIAETSSNNIIIASYGTFSTGINIRNLHHIVFASFSKSVIRVLQSIGRGARLAEGKDYFEVHDLCDNLIKKSKQNFSMQHGLARIEIYNNQKFDYEIKKINL